MLPLKNVKKIKLKNEGVILCISGHLRIGNITSQTFNQEEAGLDSVLPLTLIRSKRSVPEIWKVVEKRVFFPNKGSSVCEREKIH